MTEPKPAGRKWSPWAIALLVVLAIAGALGAVYAFWPRRPPPRDVDAFAGLAVSTYEDGDGWMKRIEAEWGPADHFKALETMPHIIYPKYKVELFDLMRRHSGQAFRNDQPHEWYEWAWSQPPADAGELSRFRVALYDAVGRPSLADYFRGGPPMTIRADEVRWGGVGRDGIPPVYEPTMVPATEATFLHDSNKVFGVRANGQARAYPRRIMGRHEMAWDTVGGEPLALVYCPLCETMIAYRRRTADGQTHDLGTSGFVYRSNKLMYDRATLSLWSTLDGEPVVGKLVNKGLKLKMEPVVTTTWGEWRSANPDTQVLSLRGLPPRVGEKDTDYSEGAAYFLYHATEGLMFPVPAHDGRLKNKAEVFVPRLKGGKEPVALSVGFLKDRPVHHIEVGGTPLVVFTTPGGASRAYACGQRRFRPGPSAGLLLDQDGVTWKATEEELRPESGKGLPRVPGHRAYWFGWYAAHPETKLVR